MISDLPKEVYKSESKPVHVNKWKSSFWCFYLRVEFKAVFLSPPFSSQSWKMKWWIGLFIAYFQWHFLEVRLKIRFSMQRFADSRE